MKLWLKIAAWAAEKLDRLDSQPVSEVELCELERRYASDAAVQKLVAEVRRLRLQLEGEVAEKVKN